MQLWLRAEQRASERRSPLTPEGAAWLLAADHRVVVEASPYRIFTDESFTKVGCEIAQRGAWVSAPEDAYILGLKELPDLPRLLHHTHIFFGHSYKQQPTAGKLLRRFARGKGVLLDLEYLTGREGRRVVAFGYWAGFVGAALALIQWATKEEGSLVKAIAGCFPYTDDEILDEVVRRSLRLSVPRVVIVGPYGRCGQGALEMCKRHGITPTLWGASDTRQLDRKALLEHDILMNCALITVQVEPFLRAEDVEAPRRLSVVLDVSCDKGSVLDPLPVVDRTTDWNGPVHRAAPITHPHGVLDCIAIDNLASMLPRQSSLCFANDLLPYLSNLASERDVHWLNARLAFDSHVSRLSDEPEQRGLATNPALSLPTQPRSTRDA